MANAPGPLSPEIARLPVTEIDIDAISPDPHQPRQSGLEDGIDELAREIRAHGLTNAIVVREPFPDESPPLGTQWILVMGERRTLAFRRLKRPTIAARIVPEDRLRDRARLLLEQIGENTFNPLSPIDKAAALARAFRLSGAQDQKCFASAYGVDATLLNRALKIEEAFAAELDEESPQGRLRAHLRKAGRTGTIRSPEALLILLSLATDHPKRVRRFLRSAHPADPISKRAARHLRERLTAPAQAATNAAPANGQGLVAPANGPGLVPVPVALLAALLEHLGVSEIPAEPARLVPLLERQLHEKRTAQTSFSPEPQAA